VTINLEGKVMANITQTIEIPKYCKIDAPVYNHTKHGWYARNSVRIDDCVPTYGNASPSARGSDLGDLKSALKQSIIYLNHRINEAEKLKKRLTELLGT
jgi:hypothetical protein